MNNTDGQFSFDNPRSANYLKGGRNTPFRLSVRAGACALDLPGSPLAVASTPDAAALDIASDIDIRVDATLSNWIDYTTALNTIPLIGKFGVGAGTKSWFFGTRNGAVYFEWSANGTDGLSASSTVPLPISPSGRMALRVTLDADNGAAGRTVTFYTASTLDGPWAQLGSTIVQAGATSIFNSALALRVGRATDISLTQPVGRVHGAEVRNGINGALVAAPDFSAQTDGASSFVDAAGRTWTVSSPAAISNRRTRLHHELTAAPVRWHPSGKHVWVPAETRGVLRRYGKSGKALDSTLRRAIPSYGPLAYWPLEDGQNATQAYSPIAGVAPLKFTRVDWASADSLLSSSALPVLASTGSDLAMMSGRIPAPATPQTSWQVVWVYRNDQANTTLYTYLRILSTGTIREWYIQQRDNLTRVIGKDPDGATVFSSDTVTGSDLFGQWIQVRFEATQNGGNVDWQLVFIDVGGDAGACIGSFAGTVGRPTGVASPPDGYASALDGLALGHISAWAPWTITAMNAYEGSIEAYTGETAGSRMQRLAAEENIPLTVCGVVDEQTLVGPQRLAAVLSLLEEAGEADGGILHEDRERLALRYRGRATMYNQEPALTLDYLSPGLADPLEPATDDEGVVNDVEVQRVGGSRARAVLEEGALSVQPPPNGVGTGYDASIPLNLHSDEQAEPIAYWQLHLGTYEGRRFPQVRVMVHRAASLVDQILAVDVGDKIVIKNPPEWLPPGDIELIVQGYEETFSTEFTWDIVFNCSPGQPWQVGTVDDAVYGRVDTDGSELAAAVDADDTTLTVLTTAGLPWTTANPALNANSDFETNLTGWNGSGGTIARVPTPQPAPFTGDWSLLFTPNGVAEFPNAGSTTMPVVVGQQYVASGWLRSATARSVALNVNWFGTSGAYLSTTSNDVTVPAGEWTWFELTATAPATALTANLAATVPDFPPVTDLLWGDHITLRQAGGSPSDFPMDIRAGGEVMAVNAITPGVADTFNRTVASGWGTADTGQAWTVVGTAADYSVGSGYGAANQPATGIAHLALAPAPTADVDLVVDVGSSVLAAGASLFAGPIVRAVDNNNHYACRLDFTTAAGVAMTVRKRVTGTETQLGTYTSGLTHTAGAFYRVRFQVAGSTLRARIWLPAAQEPSVWHIEVTDSALTAAANVGVRCFANTGSTPVNPQLRFDNFQIINPQRFTVVRSRNGIVKGHAATTDVRLAYPTIVAL
ncbi:hypothetical protein ACFWWT_04085 [Streptomyces sp. NPDC058676]|uniref:hypothetical protein n=1 Tax=Streptomyces sp. NPDC058676 TaxID=3346593 RepID=UPI00364FCD16